MQHIWRILTICALLVGIVDASSARADDAAAVLAIQRRLVQVKEKVAPAVVSISAIGGTRYADGNIYEDPFDIYKKRFFGEKSGPTPRQNVGSGVVIDADGFVLTNHHVIADTQKILITLSNGETYEARVLGSDPSVDLAVMRIEPKKKLTAIEWVEAKSIRPGQFALAFGNPWGLAQDPQPTVTLGIVSAVNRSIRISKTSRRFAGLIQTDAAINPGNSGGPLVDINGRMLGINTAIFSTTGGYQGIGFAVPISPAVEKIIERLKKGQPAGRPYIGVVVSQLSADKARLLKMEAGKGLLVERVEEDGPAARAGLKPGDVIVAFDGETVDSLLALGKLVQEAGVGKVLKLTVIRDGEERELPLEIGSREGGGLAAPSPRFWRGLSVEVIQDGKHAGKGVRVDEVLLGSPAWRAGVRAGDIVTKVNDLKVSGPQSFGDAVTGTQNQDVLLVTNNGVRVVKRR